MQIWKLANHEESIYYFKEKSIATKTFLFLTVLLNGWQKLLVLMIGNAEKY